MQPRNTIVPPIIIGFLNGLRTDGIQKRIIDQHQDAWTKLFEKSWADKFVASQRNQDLDNYVKPGFVNLVNESGDTFLFYIIKKYAEKPFIHHADYFLTIREITSQTSLVFNRGNTHEIFHLIAKQTYWDKQHIDFKTTTLYPLEIPLDQIRGAQIVLNSQHETPLAVLYATFSGMMNTQTLKASQVAAYVHLFCYFLKLDKSMIDLRLEAILAMLKLIEKTSDYKKSYDHLVELFGIEIATFKSGMAQVELSLLQSYWWSRYSNRNATEWDLILSQNALELKKHYLKINNEKDNFLDFFIKQHSSHSIYSGLYQENEHLSVLKRRQAIVNRIYGLSTQASKPIKESWTFFNSLAKVRLPFLQTLLFQIDTLPTGDETIDAAGKTCLDYLFKNLTHALKTDGMFNALIFTESFSADFKKFLNSLFDKKIKCSKNTLVDLNVECNALNLLYTQHFDKLAQNQEITKGVYKIKELIFFINERLNSIYTQELLESPIAPSHPSLPTSVDAVPIFYDSNAIERKDLFIEPPQQTLSILLQLPEKRVTGLYNQLVDALLSIWNNDEIQPIIRRLTGLSNGDRVINLSLAICEDMTLEPRVNSYILKPFVDFLKAKAKTNDYSLAEAIVEDAISSTGLMIELADKGKLSEILQKLTHEESQTNFILSLLIKNRKAQEELKAYKAAEEIFPIEFHPQQPEISIGARDLLFYCTLQELEIRAAILQKLLQKRLQPNASSYRSQTAFLVYTIKDQSFVCPLKVISSGSQSIVSIGHDDKNKTSHRLLNELISSSFHDGLSAYLIQANDLKTLQAAYKASTPPPFYLFAPVESLYLKARHEALPDLETSFLEKPKRTRKEKPFEEKPLEEKHGTDQPSEPGDRSSVLSKPERTTYPTNEAVPVSPSKGPSNSLSEYSFPTNHLLSDSFPKLNGKRNAISLEQKEEEEEDKDDAKDISSGKKEKLKNEMSNPYQSIQPLIQPFAISSTAF